MSAGPLSLTPSPKLQFFVPGTLVPASGALVFTYAAGTTTKQATYSNPNGTPNTNPIVLDANGECVCYLDSTLEYDFWYSPSNDTDPPTNPYWTVYSVGYGNMIDGLAPLNSPEFTGSPTAPTPTTGDNSTNIATTQFVATAITQSFVNPTATTPSAGDYSNKIATTAFVGQAINSSPQIAIFQSTGNWTPPTNVYLIEYRVWGAGGGGGAATSGGAAGAGGGAGAYAEGTLAVTPGTPISMTVGVGGAGATSGSPGGNGSSSSIGSSVVCGGGTGGASTSSGSASPGGNGGSATGGAINLSGNGGEPGQVQSGPGVYQGGSGGDCPLGGSGGAGAIAGANPGGTPGGGGSGGGPLINGSAGANGLIIIKWLAP